MDVVRAGTSTAAPERVWAVLSDVEAWPRWNPAMTSVERSAQGPPAGPGPEPELGSRFDVVQPRLGRAQWEVTEWEPGRSFTWESRRPGVRTTATHRLRPDARGTAIELGISWSGPGAWVARALFGRLTRRYTDGELRSLIETAESGPAG